jgi:glycosyltransferase involved in cell wall biosynthesis
MQVLHIIKGLGLAGAENHLLTLLAGLRQRGLDARLLLWASPGRDGGEILAAAQAASIPAERMLMARHLDPLFFGRVWQYLRQHQPDMVHTHLVHAETYAIPAARLAGVPYVINSSHNDDPFRRRALFRPRNRALWRMTDHGIAISEHIRQFLIQVEGARPDQVTTIHYGLSPQRLPPGQDLRALLGIPPASRLVGSVCRLVPQKGLSEGLLAMARLAADFPDLHYILAGGGALEADLRAQVESLGLSGRVHFLGWRSDAPNILRQLEILLAPSHWEGFGLVFLEAMAQARPIVATSVSAIPEVVSHGSTGLLVPPRDPAALAEAIRALLENPDRAAAMGQHGYERLLTHFNPDRMIDQTLAIYRKVQAP